MSKSTSEAIEELVGEEVSIVRAEVGALEAITRSEVAMQLDSAHRWPRSPTKFLRDAMSLATFSVEIAESCMYSVPRGGKMITGKSVRLAEICASSWGNLHVGSRVIDATDTEVVAQSVVWDLEKNVRITIEAKRSIMGKRGRFDDDMIRVTGMAAISIAFRNAVFRVIPGAYADAVYAKAKQVAVGDAKTLGTRREEVVSKLRLMGATPEAIFGRVGAKGIEDVTLEHLETLIGLGTAIKSGEVKVDEAFPGATAAAPPVVPEGTPEGKRVKLSGKKKAPVVVTAEVPLHIPKAPVSAGTPEPVAVAPSTPVTAAAPSAPSVDLVELHEMLAEADQEWSKPGGARVIHGWTPDQQLLAFTWARACVNNGPMAIQAKRPPFTVLVRERTPGEEG